MTQTDPEIIAMTPFDQVCDLIYQVSGIAKQKMIPADTLIVSLGLDSIEIIDLIMRLEERGVVVEKQHITAALSIADIVSLIDAHTQ